MLLHARSSRAADSVRFHGSRIPTPTERTQCRQADRREDQQERCDHRTPLDGEAVKLVFAKEAFMVLGQLGATAKPALPALRDMADGDDVLRARMAAAAIENMAAEIERAAGR